MGRAGTRLGGGWRGERKGLKGRRELLKAVRYNLYNGDRICTEEDILKDYGLLRQTEEIVAIGFVRGSIIRGLSLDPCPSEVDVEE